MQLIKPTESEGIERWCIHFSIVILYKYLYDKRFDSASQVIGEISSKMHLFLLDISTINHSAKHMENNIQNWSRAFKIIPLGPPPRKKPKKIASNIYIFLYYLLDKNSYSFQLVIIYFYIINCFLFHANKSLFIYPNLKVQTPLFF